MHHQEVQIRVLPPIYRHGAMDSCAAAGHSS
jgi:hypothetical protein